MRLGALASLSSAEKTACKHGFEQGFIQGIVKQAALISWSSRKVKKIVLSDNRLEAVVYDLEYRGSGSHRYLVKMRYWLRKSGPQWKLWDYETLDSGIRLSTVTSSLLSSSLPAGGSAPPVVAEINQLMVAATAMLQESISQSRKNT